MSSKNTTVTCFRNGTAVAALAGMIAQIDMANTDIQALDAGAAEYDSFMIYLRWANPDVHRGDILQDDAITSDNYEVINRPEQFPGGLAQVKAILKWGT